MRAALIIVLALLAGCSTPAQPLKPGETVRTPYQCEQLRARRGDC